MRPGPGPMPGGPMNNFSHGPPGMANPGMGIPMGPQIPGNVMSPAMGGPRAPNMMGVSPRHVIYLFVLRIVSRSNSSITKAYMRLPRVLLWRICQGVVQALLPPVNLLLTRVPDRPPSLVLKTTVWGKTSPWG